MLATISFLPFPILHTPRLLLRRIVAADAAGIFVMRADPEVMRYIPRPMAVVVEDTLPLIAMVDEAIKNGERINWGIALQENPEHLIGMIGYVNFLPEHFRAEVGYSLSRAWHRQGIMREALLRVLQYGFEEMRLHTIEAIIDEDNRPSGALLESVGFRKEARFVEDFFYDGAFRNSVHYGLLATEFIQRHPNQ